MEIQPHNHIQTMVDLLNFQSTDKKDKILYTFLENGLIEDGKRTFRELGCRARAIGGRLQKYIKNGDRVLLLFPTGLDYIDAFWGTIFSGAIAVTAYPPSYNKKNERLDSIVKDCTPSFILTNQDIYENRKKLIKNLSSLEKMVWISSHSIDDRESDTWTDPGITPDSIAFLQYTSGSTSEPKGVMVTHRNLLSNEELIRESFGHDENSTVVGWLPMYHDMGLIGNILQPVYSGAKCYLMSPFSFLKRPIVWLKAISKYRAHTSGGPNFAYNLLSRTVKQEELEELDLSCWKVAFNGSEPVHYSTLKRFEELFKVAGFNRVSFYPCYGLAEATLFVTGGSKNDFYKSIGVDRNNIENHIVTIHEDSKAHRLVGSGLIRGSYQQVMIVDPDTRNECEAGQIGEIWVTGESIAAGYWNNPVKTRETFGAYIKDTNRGAFLRTGDLGFLNGSELYVTGRIKELIIICGRNYYPHDIEKLVESRDSLFKNDCAAAFSVDIKGEEKLVVVQEVKNRADTDQLDQVLDTIRCDLIDILGVDPHEILIVESGSIPKTTSGKTKRMRCRGLYLSNEFKIVKSSKQSEIKEDVSTDSKTHINLSDIKPWIKKRIGQNQHLSLVDINQDACLTAVDINEASSLTAYGYDSIKCMKLAHDIEKRFSISLPVDVFFKSETIGELIRNIQDEVSAYKKGIGDKKETSDKKESQKRIRNVTFSPAQMRLWFLNKIAKEKYVYNVSVSIEISGKLNKEALKSAIEKIQERHHILKTRFIEDENDVVFSYCDKLKINIEEIDLTDLEADKKWRKIEQIKLEKSKTVFDLENGPYWLVTLVVLNDNTSNLIVVAHHMIADGWSMNIFIDELKQYYLLYKEGKEVSSPDLPVQFSDLIMMQKSVQQEGTQKSNHIKNIEYWKSLLTNQEHLLLPSDFTRPAIQSFRGRKYPLKLSEEMADRLKKMANKKDVSIFTFLMAVYVVFLYRYTGKKTINIGIPVANRDSLASSRLIGLFMDTLVLSTTIEQPSFNQLLSIVKKNIKEALIHKDVSFAELIRELNPVRDASVSPLYQVMFIYQNGVIDSLVMDDLILHPRQIDNQTSKFNLTLELFPCGKSIEGWFEYNTDLFTEVTISRMADHFYELLMSALTNPDEKINYLNIHCKKEKDELIYGFNNTSRDYGKHISVHLMFEKQVLNNPDKIAVVCKKENVTYDQLNRRANQIANYLIKKGKCSESLIAICLNRSVNMIASVVGVLKAGLAYLPLDPFTPEERNCYILKDAGIKTIISDGIFKIEKSQDNINVINLNDDIREIEGFSGSNPGLSSKENDLAYTIYTSGSTGKPKGVQIEHGSLTNFLMSMAERPGICGDDILLAVTTLAFDISNLEIFLPLINGARVIVASRDQVYSGNALINLINRDFVSIMQATPTTWKMMIDDGWEGSSIKSLCGGEVLSNKLAAEIVKRSNSLWNLYGPTETTIWSSVAELKKGFQIVTLGRPISNTSMYVLDEQNRILPSGVPGELCIGGKGLARGYLNRDDLTDKKFTQLQLENESIRIYKTGDLVRQDPEKGLIFINRIDNQVKIRGHRVELGEIESAVKSAKGIEDCVVSIFDSDDGRKMIVAYVIPEDADTSILDDFMREKLPSYMLPSCYITLDIFPLNPNGKIDRNSLPVPDLKIRGDYKNGFPKNVGTTERFGIIEGFRTIENQVAKIWKEVLGRDDISVDDNFFDAGGDSLLLGKLHSNIEKVLNIEFDLLRLFEKTTIRSQANYFLNNSPTGYLSKIGYSRDETDAIAIIGISCRVPGASNKNQFWNNITHGKESITRFNDKQLVEAGVDPALLTNNDYVKAWGKLEDVDMFDAEFFGFTPREAKIIDPQHRIFLEECYRALEDGGYGGRAGNIVTGVFAGTGMNTYLDGILNWGDIDEGATSYQYMISNDKDFLSTRVAYRLGLKGPAISVQTACSTSLVAVHLACQSLKQGESDMALAGGVSVRLPQDRGYLYQAGMILSPDGKCRAFDEKANGTVPGNGAGVVLLKRYNDAVRDGDNIYAIIKGSSINNDGQEKIGYTAPSITGQMKVIENAIESSGISVDDLVFIENHGTGTKLGDPIEIEALKKAFGSKTDEKGFCALGSVKTNIGHLDCAAGVISLIKSVMSLKTGIIPPSLHYSVPNPNIDFKDSPFYVSTELKKIDKNKKAVCCGISSFGIGGTNCHMILEQYRETNRYSDVKNKEKELFVLSANSLKSLDKLTSEFGKYLKSQPAHALADIAYTLKTARREFKHRRIFVSGSIEEAVNITLNNNLVKRYSGIVPDEIGKLIFMFPGQGSQYLTMAKGLYISEKGFKKRMDRCTTLIQKYAGFDILKIIYPENEEYGNKIDMTEITQLTLFAVEYSVAKHLISIGLKPEVMIGHSLGEYVAACVAGVFSLEEAIKLIVFRAKLMNSLPPGTMLAVFANEVKLEKMIGDTLSIAAVNGPSLTVVSGNDEAINRLKHLLELERVLYKELKTSHAFHSVMMEPILKEFHNYLTNIRMNKPEVPFISNYTGDWIGEQEAMSPGYWVSHLRNRVRFSKGLKLLLGLNNPIFVETGPGRVLSGLIREHDKNAVVMQTIPHPKEIIDDHQFFLTTIGKLWCHGLSIDWNRTEIDGVRKKTGLPPYPFDRQRYWISPDISFKERVMKQVRKSLSGWFNVPSWKNRPLAMIPREKPYRNILIFSDNCGLSIELCNYFRQKDKQVSCVSRGTRFSKILDNHTDNYTDNHTDNYTVNIVKYEDYLSLFIILKEKERLPDIIIHAWNVSDTDYISNDKESSFFSLVYLSQAVAQIQKSQSVELNILSNNTHLVTGSETIIPMKSLLNGPVRVISQEMPDIKCRNIDFLMDDWKVSDTLSNTLIRQLLSEIENPPTESFIAIRGMYRWIRSFEQVDLEDRSRNLFMFKENNIYLITGGTGGLGLVFAKFLAEQNRLKIVLLGHSPFPDREKWGEYLRENRPEADKIEQIEQIEALGSEVIVCHSDVSDRQVLFKTLDKISNEIGTINGVIHAAGVAGDGLIPLKTREAAIKVLAPKVDGTKHLDEYFKEKDLEFFVLFSSITSICGGIGQIDYCSANAFLDAFAHQRHNRPYPIVSINWDTWKETGVASKVGKDKDTHVNKDLYSNNDTYVNKETAIKNPLLTGYVRIGKGHERYFSDLVSEIWVFKEHSIMGRSVLPGTVYLEMLTAIIKEKHPDHIIQFKDIHFLTPIAVEENSHVRIEIDLKEIAIGYDFTISSKVDGLNIKQSNAKGTLIHFKEVNSQHNVRHRDLAEIEADCSNSEITNPKEIARIARITDISDGEKDNDMIQFGPRWENIKWIKVGINEGIALLMLPDRYKQEIKDFIVHPALLDCAVAFLRIFKYKGIFIPLSYQKFTVYKSLPGRFYSHVKLLGDAQVEREKEILNFSVSLIDTNGLVIAEVEKFTMRKMGMNVLKMSKKGVTGGSPINRYIGLDALKMLNKSSGPVIDNPVDLFRQERVQEGIKNEEGKRAFHYAISSTLPQVIISTYDLFHRIIQYNDLRLFKNKETRLLNEDELHPRPEMNNAYVPPRNDLEKKIADIWRSLLGLREVGVQDDIFELGAHSLLIAEFYKKFLDTFDTDLSTDLSANSSINLTADLSTDSPTDLSSNLSTDFASNLTANLSIVDLYKYTTIERFTEHLLSSQSETNHAIKQVIDRVNKKKELKRKRKREQKKRRLIV